MSSTVQNEKPLAEWNVGDFLPFFQKIHHLYRQGELYTTYNLHESIAIVTKEKELPSSNKRQDKEHPYNNFLRSVADEIRAARKGTKFGSTKAVVEKMREFDDAWVAFLLDPTESTPPAPVAVTATATVTSAAMPQAIPDEVVGDTKPPVPRDDVSKPPTSPSRKPPVDTPEPVSPMHEASPLPVDDVEPRTPTSQARWEKRKKEFEEGVQQVMEDVPEHAKARFGEVCFAKWGKVYLPALVVSPYSVAPGPVRQQWFAMKENVAERPNKMTHLCYWYGAYNDMGNAYSFSMESQILSYQDGMKKKLHVIPNTLQKKLDAGKKLTPSEDQRVRGLKEMEADLKKKPSERRGFVEPFLEVYDFDTDSDDDSMEKVVGDTETPKRKTPKKSKSKKRKSTSRTTGDAESNLDDQIEATPKKKSKTTKKKAKGKKSTPSDNGTMVDAIPEESKTLPVAVEGIEDFGDDDISSHHEKDDEDARISSESDEDVNDDDYVAEASSKKPKKKDKTGVKKITVKKKAQTVKTKVSKKIEGQGKEKKAPSQKKLKRVEQERFEECERTALPLLKQCTVAIEKRDTEVLSKSLQEIKRVVNTLSNPFIEEYDVVGMLKKAKELNKGCPIRKDLWIALKAVHEKQQRYVPPGFKAKKTATKIERPKEPPLNTHAETPATLKNVNPPRYAESNPSTAQKESVSAGPDPSSTPLKGAGSVHSLGPDDKKLATPTKKPEKKKEKKKFSLGGLMRPSSSGQLKETPTASSVTRVQSATPTTSQSSIQAPKKPTWISQHPLTDLPSDDNRTFALEFFKQAAPCIPPDQDVDHGAIALALEAATHGWAISTYGTDWINKYWEKTHEIVASISGEKKRGTLATMIAEGEIKSPDIIPRLTGENIIASFEGRPLAL